MTVQFFIPRNQSSTPLLERPGNCILACFDTFHIDAHIAVGGKAIFRAAASNMDRVRTGNHRLCRNASRIHAGAAKFVTFDDGDCLARTRKSRCQGRACLARPDDDCVEVLHAASAPSMWVCPLWLPLRASSILARDNVGGIPARPVVLGSGWFVLAMMFLSLSQQLRQRRNVKIADALAQAAAL